MTSATATATAAAATLLRLPRPLPSYLSRLPLSHSLRPPPLISSPFRLFTSHCSRAPSLLDLPRDLEEDEQQQEVENLEFDLDEQKEESQEPVKTAAPLPKLPCPKLTVKEKKELASYAHSLGKKLKCQQVGKSGVTAAVAASFVQTLEANELLKLKVHGNCPEEFKNVIKQLEESTGSVAVGQIGRSIILYRPSLTKLKKEEAQADTKINITKYRKPQNKFQWNGKSTGSANSFKVRRTLN